jgi:hypothetical protein
LIRNEDNKFKKYFISFATMDEIQIIVYIIFALIYFVFKALQKGREQQQGQGHGQGHPEDFGQPHDRPRPTTFEDLLKELAGEPIEEPKRPEVTPSKARQVYSEEAEREVEERYHNSVKEASQLKTLDEIISFEKLNEEMSKKEPIQVIVDEDGKTENPYLKILREEDGVKKAFVLSEILQKKHF